MPLPFVMPSIDVFFASQRRAFAHYFYPFPLSIDNQPGPSDYYNTQFLTVGGEGGRHASYGGYLRSRPFPAQPGGPNFKLVNMQFEVDAAMARGITGFTFDILSYTDALDPAGHLSTMLTAAQAMDPRFAIIPMLDMSAMVGLTQTQAATLIASFKHPSFLREDDGRVLVAAYMATLQPPGWWQGVFDSLNAQDIDIAFLPVLLGSPTMSVLDPISIGTADWGTATATGETAAAAYMSPILPQQFRPKAQKFWEASNSSAYRNGWMSAINGAGPYAQLVTWSDFSESGQVQPYTDATLATNIGTGFYDLTAYYATWFATGAAPKITKDVLYWFYRRMSSSALHPNQPLAFSPVGTPEESNIELLAFLTHPGTLMINGAGIIAPPGVSSFKQPVAPGFPQFRLQRNGSDVFEFKGPVQIYGPQGSPAGTLDLTYWSGSHSN